MQAGVAAVIADVVINMASNISKEREIISRVVMMGAFIATYFFKVNVMYIILVCGIIGALKVVIKAKKKGGDEE